MYNNNGPSTANIIERLEARVFRPVNNGKTFEPSSGKDGLDDFENDDWKVRTLALRELLRLGNSEALAGLLGHSSPEVRYLAATTLGILEAESSLDRLHRFGKTRKARSAAVPRYRSDRSAAKPRFRSSSGRPARTISVTFRPSVESQSIRSSATTAISPA